MRDVIVLGTDTGVGKTTFSLLWMAAFSEQYEYWKPVETGDSDTVLVQRLVPAARVHTPAASFREAAAPAVAARREQRRVPTCAEIIRSRPHDLAPGRSLLVETFGSPLSPLSDEELQVEIVRQFGVANILVGSSTIGAVGRTLQCLTALAAHDVHSAVVVLLGPNDRYAEDQIQRHGKPAGVFSLERPQSFDADGIARSAYEQRGTLAAIRACVACSQAVGFVPAAGPDTSEAIRERRATPQDVTHQSTEDEMPVGPDTLVDRDRRVIWHPYTSLQDPDAPLVVAAAQDEFLFLADGRRVIDGISSWWTVLHGHRHPVLMEALAQAARAYDHVHFAGVTHPPAVELAELMLSTMPWRDGRVFFSDDGSTAVEVALKMAYQFWCHRGEPQRTLFVGFEGGYHGDTFGAMSVGRDPVFFGRFEPLLFRAESVPVCAERLDELLDRTSGHVAAVIIEPLVQGAGGMRMHTADQLRAIGEVARRHDVLFIVDEVMTGGGRTGELWAHQSAGITPDLVCAGKTIAGGLLPIAATLVAPHVVAAFETADRSRTFFHGHSFTAHPLACAVGAANWRMLTKGVGNAPAVMQRFWEERLAPLQGAAGIRDVRIRGTIAAIELDAPGGYLADIGRELRRQCLARGVLLRPLGNVLYAMPPFCTSEDSLDRIATAMENAVRLCRSHTE